MLVPIIIMGVIAIVLLFIGYQRGGGEHILGLKSTANMLIQIVPLLIFAFVIAGMIQVLIPHEMITRWGRRGIWFSGHLDWHRHWRSYARRSLC